MKGGEFKGNFAKLMRRQSIRQEFTSTDNVIFNRVVERHIVMVKAAGVAVKVQTKSLFRGSKIPSGGKLWFSRNYWASYALRRKATIVNVVDSSPFEMCFGTVPQNSEPDPFPQARVRENQATG